MLRSTDFFMVPVSKPYFRNSQTFFWLGISLLFALYFGIVALIYLFQYPNLIQDDARTYLIWMQQFTHPNLLPDDIMVHYFKSVIPSGYAALFYGLAQIGIEPMITIKVIPLILGMITSIYCFAVFLELIPVPFGAFLSTLILNQALWLGRDLITGVPRAFIYLFCLAFIYYLLKQKFIPLLIAIAAQGLFYPSVAMVQIGVLTIRLFRLERWRLKLSNHSRDYLYWGAGLGILLLILLVYSGKLFEFGPVVTAAQMKAMPEFGSAGRLRFFRDSPLEFWRLGDSGIHPPSYPPIIWISVLLPFLLRGRVGLAQTVTPAIGLLPKILLSSLAFFFLSHAVLLKLFSPSRMTKHTLIIVMSLAAGMTVLLLLEKGMHWWSQQRQMQASLSLVQWLQIGLIGLFLTASVVIPGIPAVVSTAYNLIPGKSPGLYQFLQRQPFNTLIASVAEEANNLPIFAQRSILVGREYALPYHLEYYNVMKQRATDLIRAHYSTDINVVRQFIQTYRVNYFLFDQDAFTIKYLEKDKWLQLYQPVTDQGINSLKKGDKPILAQLEKSCTVFQEQKLTLIEARCVLERDY